MRSKVQLLLPSMAHQLDRILSVVDAPCLEAEALRSLPHVETARPEDLGVIGGKLEGPPMFDLMRRLKERFPDPPRCVYIFGKDPILSYQLQHVMSLLYDNPPEIAFFKVEMGSLFTGYGRVVSEQRLQGRYFVPNQALYALGRDVDNRTRNILVTVYLLKASVEKPIYLSIIQDFMKAYLKKKYTRNLARRIWQFCIKCHLANVEPAYILERTPTGGLGQRRKVWLLRANNVGLSWAANYSNRATDDSNLKDIDAQYTEMEQAGLLGKGAALIDGKELLSDLCPVVKQNEKVFSLFSSDMINPKEALLIGIPSPCVFGFPKVRADSLQSLLVNSDHGRVSEDEASRLFLKLLGSHELDGKLIICCSSPRDSQAGLTGGRERIVGSLERTDFEYAGSCPYKMGEICTIATPFEVLEPLKEQLHPDIRQLKARGK